MTALSKKQLRQEPGCPHLGLSRPGSQDQPRQVTAPPDTAVPVRLQRTTVPREAGPRWPKLYLYNNVDSR